MRLLPYRRDVVAAALPVDEAFGPPSFELRQGDRRRVALVRRADQGEAEVGASAPAQLSPPRRTRRPLCPTTAARPWFARRGPSGSGDGAKRAVSTPEPGITHDAVPVDAQPCNERRVVRVLGQAGGAPAVQHPAKRRAHERAQQPRSQIAGREHVTQPGQCADDRRNAGEPRRSAAVEHRLHRDGMDDVRPLGPIDAHERGKRAQVRQRRDSSPLHGDGQHPHSFGADRIAVGRDRAGNGDGEAGVPRRPRDRHPVGDEEAVVARDEKQFRLAFTGASVFRFDHRGPPRRPLTASKA